MNRTALALLAVLIIPACNHGHHDDADHQVTVSNLGDEPALVKITHERAEWYGGGHEDTFTYELAAGDQRLDVFPSTHEVKIYITRKSDGMVLFAENIDLNDFDRHDDHVWITVNP